MKIVVKYQFSKKDSGCISFIESTSTILDVEHVSNASIRKAIESTLSSGEELVLIQKITALKQNITVIDKTESDRLKKAERLLALVLFEYRRATTTYPIGFRMFIDIEHFLKNR